MVSKATPPRTTSVRGSTPVPKVVGWFDAVAHTCTDVR